MLVSNCLNKLQQNMMQLTDIDVTEHEVTEHVEAINETSEYKLTNTCILK